MFEIDDAAFSASEILLYIVQLAEAVDYLLEVSNAFNKKQVLSNHRSLMDMRP